MTMLPTTNRPPAKKWGNALSIIGEMMMMSDPAYANAGMASQQNRIATMKEREAEAEEANKRSALARIAQDMVPGAGGAPMDTETALARIAEITGDPTALINFRMDQNDPIKKIQLANANLGLENARKEGQRADALANFFKGQGMSMGESELMGPFQPGKPNPGPMMPGQMGDPVEMARQLAVIDPEAFGDNYLSILSSQGQAAEPTFIPGNEGYIMQNGQAVKIPGLPDVKAEDLKDAIIPELEILPGAAPTKDDAKVVKNVVQAKRQLDTLVSEYADLVQKYGFEPEGSNDAGDLRQKEAQIQIQMKNLEELGALQAPDLEVLRNMMGSPVMERTGVDNFIPAPLGVLHPYKAATARGRAGNRVEDFRIYLDDRVSSVLATRGYRAAEGSDMSDDPMGLFQ